MKKFLNILGFIFCLGAHLMDLLQRHGRDETRMILSFIGMVWFLNQAFPRLAVYVNKYEVQILLTICVVFIIGVAYIWLTFDNSFEAQKAWNEWFIHYRNIP